MPNLNIPLTVTGTDFITVLPDGTEYKTSSTQHCNTIGEKKRIKWKFSSSYADLSGVNVYLQLGLFQQGVVNSPTPKIPLNYQGTFPSGLAAGDYQMALVLPSGANANLNNNASVILRILTSSTFHIVVDFYQIYDEMQYQNVSFQDNHNKLLLDQKQNTSELTLGALNNCYNSNRSQFAITMKLEKPGVLHAPDTYLYTDNALAAMGANPWLAGFYNRNSNDSSPYFSNPVFEFTRSGAVTNLSAYVDTNVLFKIDAPVSVSKVLFWIIRTDTTDNTKTMVDNYEANFEEIVNTNANIGASTNKFTTPVINVVLDSGSTYKVGCAINHNNLTSGGKYRIIAIVYYSSGGTYQSNSFISDELTCDDLPKYEGNGLDVLTRLSDYNRQFSGNDLQCVIEERIKSTVKLEYAFDKWKNDIFNRLGLVVSNDIRRYLQNVIFTIYDTNVDMVLGIVQNIYEYQVATKQSLLGLTYNVPSDMTMDFSDNWSEFTYEWRNRFESNTACIGTLVNGVPTNPVQGVQYWGGKTLTIKWTFQFIYDDYVVPFQDDIYCTQQIRVKDYERKDLEIKHINEFNEYDNQSNFCSDLKPCFVSLIPAALTDRKLIVNIFPENGAVNTVEEAEIWVGNQLEQLTTDKIINEEEDYVTESSKKVAKFCVDLSKLSLNSSYQLSTIAKKYVDTGYRVTEKNNPSVIEPRITESNDKRIID